MCRMLANCWQGGVLPRPRKPVSPFRYFNSSPEIIRLAVWQWKRHPDEVYVKINGEMHYL
jgi:hypothetical protein